MTLRRAWTFCRRRRRLWEDLAAGSRKNSCFMAGAALALHLGHRESLDFDFFGNNDRLIRRNWFPLFSFLVGAIVTQP